MVSANFILFDFLNGKTNLGELVLRHPKDLFFNTICVIPALVIGGALLIGEIAAGRSGIMFVVAKKERV